MCQKVQGLRDVVVIPLRKPLAGDFAQQPKNTGVPNLVDEKNLFTALGQETGVRKLVEKVFELAKRDDVTFFKNQL